MLHFHIQNDYMKKVPLILAICFGILFVYMTVTLDNKNNQELKFIKNNEIISYIKVRGIYNAIGNEVAIAISDKNELDSINFELLNNLKPSGNQKIAGVQILRVIFEITKGNNKCEILIANSKYDGWLLQIGGKCYTNNFIFKLVQKYDNKYNGR